MIKNTLLIAIINIASILFIEYALSFFIFQKNIRNFSDTKRITVPYRKNETAWLNSNEFSVKYYINNLGVRDKEGSTNRFGNYDMLLLGDSFSEGWGVKYEDSYFKIIESKSQKKHFNFSQNGSSPVLYYHRLKFLLKQNKFKKVLIQIFDNDIHDNYRLRNINPNNNYEIEEISFIGKVKNYIKSKFRLYYLIKRIIHKAKGKPMPSFQFSNKANTLEIYEQEKIIDKFNIANNLSELNKWKQTDFSWYINFDEAKWRESFKLHRKYLEKIITLCKQKNIDLEILYIPYHGVFYLDEVGKNKITNHHQTMLKEMSKEFGFKLIDLYDQFINDPSSRSYFFALDGHLNKIGHKKVANIYLEQR